MTTRDHHDRIQCDFDAMPRKSWAMLYAAKCSLEEQRPGKAENIELPDGQTLLCYTLESMPRFDGLWDTVWIEHVPSAVLRRGYEPRLWVTGPYLRPAMSLDSYASRHHRTRSIV